MKNHSCHIAGFGGIRKNKELLVGNHKFSCRRSPLFLSVAHPLYVVPQKR